MAKASQTQANIAKGSVVALVVSALTALGLAGPKLLSVADVQLESAASEIHKVLDQKIEKLDEELDSGIERVRAEMREQHVQTTDRLDRIFEAVSRGR